MPWSAERKPKTKSVTAKPEAVARLDHPNIVPVFEVGQYKDQHYFSMKLIAGDSLDKRLKAYLTDARGAAELVATAAEAIHHAHQRLEAGEYFDRHYQGCSEFPAGCARDSLSGGGPTPCSAYLPND
jgi:serine/threonine protein kinase